jgi:hypothetical protein
MANNNNGNLLDTAGNVFVDFAWGNFPMQPNDERTSTADYTTAPSTAVVAANASQNFGWSGYTVYPSSRLNPTLSFHDMAEAKYAGFPAFASGDGAYISGVAYISVPNVIGLTTALAVDALRDAGYETANITTSSAVTPAISNVALTDNVATITANAHGYAIGQSVVIAGLTNTVLNGTYTIASTATNTFTYAKTNDNIVSVADTGTAKVMAKAGTIKTQSTAAGAGSVASTATITIAPYFAS